MTSYYVTASCKRSGEVCPDLRAYIAQEYPEVDSFFTATTVAMDKGILPTPMHRPGKFVPRSVLEGWAKYQEENTFQSIINIREGDA